MIIVRDKQPLSSSLSDTLFARAGGSGTLAFVLAVTPFGAAAQESGTDQASDHPDKSSPQVEADVPPAAFSGRRSRETLITQVLLDRSRHSPGVIDGYAGGNTTRALDAFKREKGTESSGNGDHKQSRQLSSPDTASILVTYTITEQDASGDFKPVPSGFAAMAKRDRLGYASIEELLAEKFHMTTGLFNALNPDAKYTAGSDITVVAGEREAALESVTRIEVDKAKSEVRAYSGAGKLVATYPATVGSGDFPSPSGTMKVAAIAEAPNYTFDPDDQSWGGDQARTLPPGPNNPVGGTWIDLGKNGYGIHGTPDPSAIGKTASHGCVRLTNWDAAELAKAVKPGETEVMFK